MADTINVTRRIKIALDSGLIPTKYYEFYEAFGEDVMKKNVALAKDQFYERRAGIGTRFAVTVHLLPSQHAWYLSSDRFGAVPEELWEYILKFMESTVPSFKPLLKHKM